MPILFSAVAFERKIISHFACCDGNFMEIAEQIITKLPTGNNKMTYSHGIYLLHYIAEDDYVYFCITDKLCQRSRTFLFLNEIQRRFIANMDLNNTDITTTLAGEMYRYSEDYNTITIRRGELDELNKIGVGCSEDLLGEKILYVNNPDNISYSKLLKNPCDLKVEKRKCVTKKNFVYETISYVGCTPEQVTVSVIPRWYVIIIGMAILIIAMTVYTFGPISCAVVTIIGLYSLLRTRMQRKTDQ